MKFSIKDFFSKCDQIRSFLRIWLHLLNKSLMENFIFCAASLKKSWVFLCNKLKIAVKSTIYQNSDFSSITGKNLKSLNINIDSEVWKLLYFSQA